MASTPRIYTRTGDDGTTGLGTGVRVSKDSLRIDAYGTVDELNSSLGVALAAAPNAGLIDPIRRIQRALFVMGADLCVPEQSGVEQALRMQEQSVTDLEALIDTLDQELDPLRNFILPGGTPAAAQFHLARTICRRAERKLVLLNSEEPIGAPLIRYLNRLSDLLFVLARVENARGGHSDITWDGRS